jgi:regulator of sirC expression with transglutaminase-like and TPR domain
MQLLLTAPTPLAYFSTLVQSDAHFPLLEAAISLGQDDYPELDVQQVLGEVDQLQARLQRRISVDATPLHKLRMLSQFFYRDLKFGGNVNNYYDPDNSYISQVLHSRRGIPISLAVLWLELAQGLGLAANGVGFPGHFMLKVSLPLGQVVIDPMSGQSLSRDDLLSMLEPYQGRASHPGWADEAVPMGLYLQSASPRDIIARMLRNLKEIHTTQEDWPRMLAVQNRLLVLLPEAWDEYRDRGLTHAELGQMNQAVKDLETYLFNVHEGLDVHAISQRAVELRRALG